MNDPKLDVTKAQEPISYGRRLGMLAAERCDATAIVFVPTTGVERRITWKELEETSNRVTRLLADHGVSDGDMVAVGLRNSPEHFFVTYAV